MAAKKVISMGIKFDPPPPGVTYVKIISYGFRNPYFIPSLKGKTGLDPAVAEYVHTTHNYRHKLKKVMEIVRESTTDDVYLACIGGQHRSVVIAEDIAREMSLEVEHRDIDKAATYA